MEQHVDLLVVGGGIHGTAIAKEASHRGLKVWLVEQNDLASGTSSASSKLIHGGLRYLENYQFRMVRQALQSQKDLLRHAPHLVHELRFIIPISEKTRPSWLIYLGLKLYDFMRSPSSLKKSIHVHLPLRNTQPPLQRQYQSGFVFSDCITDDSRLVIENALQVQKNGGKVLNYTSCLKAVVVDGKWYVTLKNHHNGETQSIYARALINATGPWDSIFKTQVLGIKETSAISLIKGTHIIVPRLYPSNEAYLLQNKDHRIIFVIPYLNQFSLIGTTESHYQGDMNGVKAERHEIEYLCQSVNQYFTSTLHVNDVLHSFSGVRALLRDSRKGISRMSREFKIDIDKHFDAPLIHVLGGKLTTHAPLAVQACDALKPFFENTKPISNNLLLPGSHLGIETFSEVKMRLLQAYAFLPSQLLNRYVNTYGTLAAHLLEEVHTLDDLGTHFGHHLYAKEVDYLLKNEWARTTSDILWRRTKFGLLFHQSEIDKLEKYISTINVNHRSWHKDGALKPLWRE